VRSTSRTAFPLSAIPAVELSEFSFVGQDVNLVAARQALPVDAVKDWRECRGFSRQS
jgi:hypothetical protein